jgi:hypothetical protein
MELIREFETQLKYAISTAYTGHMAPENSLIILAHAEGTGFGKVKFVSLKLDRGDIIEIRYSYDTGSYTVGTSVPMNGSTMIITNDRRYLVTQQHAPGESLSIEDTRLTSLTITPNCGLMVHIGGNTHRVLVQGTFQCTVGTGNKHKIANWGKDQYITLGHMDSCHTECMTTGPAMYRTEHRDLGTYPSVHPVMLRNYAPSYSTVMRDVSTPSDQDKAQRELHALIADTRTQLDLMNIEQSAEDSDILDRRNILPWTAVGIIIALLVAVTAMGYMIFRYKKSRGQRVQGQQEQQQHRADRWGTATGEQGQVMEMRIIPSEPEYRQYGANRGKRTKLGGGGGGGF